jgi:hypothetical protein
MRIFSCPMNGNQVTQLTKAKPYHPERKDPYLFLLGKEI